MKNLFIAWLVCLLNLPSLLNGQNLNKIEPADSMVLNYHLMHPGGNSLPGDPNAAFYLDGLYHLHYILAHPFKQKILSLLCM